VTLHFVTITGTLGGAGQGGTAVFTPSGWFTDTADELLIPPAAVTAPVAGAAGTFSVSLLANDNAALSPSSGSWSAVLTPGFAAAESFSFVLSAGPFAFTATHAAPAVFTAAPASGQPWSNGMAVTLAGAGIPGGFGSTSTYWVTGGAGSTFFLAATSGGTAIASSTAGTGTALLTQMDISTVA
jgi:hypothetical protein